MHRIIALWCHPRSMSTAIERIMRERGDFQCLHEPFMYDYYVHRQVRRMPHFEAEKGRPVSYTTIREDLVQRAEGRDVFIKDMSYYVMPAMREDSEFARRLIHAFLIRNPMRSILSYHRLDPDVSCEEIGLEAQWRHFEWLRDALGMTPAVLEAESVQAAPRTVLRAWWSKIGLDFVEDAFTWSGEEAPEEWEQVAGWHGDVQQSTSIRPISDEEEAGLEAEFEAAARAQPRLRALLDHHRPCYERLRAEALSTAAGG